MGKRAVILSALLALLATLLLVQPASAQEDPCANPPEGAILGTAGNDVLRGTPGPDLIVAGDGNDVILGLGGDDFICAGLGNDKVITGDGDDGVAADDFGFFPPGGPPDPGEPEPPAAGGNDVVITGAGDDEILA